MSFKFRPLRSRACCHGIRKNRVSLTCQLGRRKSIFYFGSIGEAKQVSREQKGNQRPAVIAGLPLEKQQTNNAAVKNMQDENITVPRFRLCSVKSGHGHICCTGLKSRGLLSRNNPLIVLYRLR